MRTRFSLRYFVVGMVCLLATTTAQSQTDYSKVFTGYTKVVSTVDGSPPMWEVWVNKKTNQVLAQLPRDFDKKKYFIAVTVASGERFAGLQAGDYYVYWKRVGDRLMLIQPNLEVRSTGDQESKSSVKRIFTDKLLLDLPVLATSVKGEPVIDLDELMVKNASTFFGSAVRGSSVSTMTRLQVVRKAKAFPLNIELAFEVPLSGGQLKSLHYSVSTLPTKTGYKPRKADDRVGFFTTAYDDLGKFKEGEKRARYINRWQIEKADPTLKVSPPKKPIIFYVEHTTPIRYRRYVREGVLYWNKAFEKVGFFGAIEVYFQDATTKAHMDKDPEDVRYNFIRWLNNDISTAIGPSRVDPRTGQILDADIVLTDGWIRVFEQQFTGLLPDLAMQGFGPNTLSWLDEHPDWDPRLLLAAPHQRNLMLKQRALHGAQPLSGHPFGSNDPQLIGDDAHDGLVGRTSQINGMCMAAMGKSLDMTLLRMMVALAEDAPQEGEKKEDEEKLDGLPARFVGPLLADLVAHEVGHTLGLRHNFKASALYTLAEINSDAIKGKKPFTASVMDYNPLNVNMKDGKVQGDFAMIDIGPYDQWAIEYGYTMNEADLPKILARCTEKELQYLTDQDTIGPDPFARRYDFTANPLDYAKNQMKLAKYHRERLLDKYVKDGDSWAKARQGYNMTLNLQVRAVSMMNNWLGGAFIRRDHKGDKDNRPPIEPVAAAVQRDALKWIMENAFRDQSFGLTPEILKRLRKDFLESDETFSSDDSLFPVHDRIMSVQSSVLTMVMNPTTLRRVYDNELIVEADKDAFTLPEILNLLKGEIWSELKLKPDGKYSARKPMTSSLRRNLQRTHIERLIDLANVQSSSRAAIKPVSTLARLQLKQLGIEVDKAITQGGDKLDAYTAAHLEDVKTRIEKGLDARYVVDPTSSRTSRLIIGSPAQMRCVSPNCRHCRPVSNLGWDDR